MSLADAAYPNASSPFLQHSSIGPMSGSAASSAASSSLSSSDAANAASVPLTLAMMSAAEATAGGGGRSGIASSAQVPIFGTQQTLSGTMGGAERSAKVSRCFGNTTLCMPQTLLCFKVRFCT